MGQTLEQAAPKVHVAEIVQYGEQLILPTGMNMDQAIELIQRRKEYLGEKIVLSEAFDVFPWDGAFGLQKVLSQRYGWAQAVATPGFFGSNPPEMISVQVGFNQTTQVPWGRFSLPNVPGYVECSAAKKDGRLVFAIEAVMLRKDEETVKDLFRDLRVYLANNSIYRGKAFKLRLRSSDGSKLALPEPEFLDTESIDENMLIYSDDVRAQVETNLFTPILRVHDCKANGIPTKRGVLLGGKYGTGKTLAATVASKLAVRTGITYIYVPRADELAEAIQFAKMYQDPACVIFVEDIDRAVTGERSVAMDDILNIVDGIDTKNANIITVLTTNHVENINPAMLRPGRLDAVINVTPPDARAVERLIRAYAGVAVSDSVDLTSVGEVLAGQIPAVIAEVVKRAKLAQLRLQEPGTLVTTLTGEALLESAKSMAAQLSLLDGPRAEEKPTLETVMHGVVQNALNGTKEKISTTARQVGELHARIM